MTIFRAPSFKDIVQDAPAPGDHLLIHLEKFYGDRSIADEMDCVLPVSESVDAVIKAYVRARKRAPGYRRFDCKANSHKNIKADDWARVEKARRKALDSAADRSARCRAKTLKIGHGGTIPHEVQKQAPAALRSAHRASERYLTQKAG